MDAELSLRCNYHYWSVAGLLLTQTITALSYLVLPLCAIGLGTFAIAGMEKALSYGISPGYAILCGMISGCFGGLIRDVLCNEIPLIFRKEVYALPALVGASAYLGLDYLGVIPEVSFPITIVLVILFRVFAVRYNWQLPQIRMD